MAKKQIRTKIRAVRAGIETQLEAEKQGLNYYGVGLQREGFVGGYLQALSDVMLALDGITNGDGRFIALWKEVNNG